MTEVIVRFNEHQQVEVEVKANEGATIHEVIGLLEVAKNQILSQKTTNEGEEMVEITVDQLDIDMNPEWKDKVELDQVIAIPQSAAKLRNSMRAISSQSKKHQA